MFLSNEAGDDAKPKFLYESDIVAELVVRRLTLTAMSDEPLAGLVIATITSAAFVIDVVYIEGFFCRSICLKPS